MVDEAASVAPTEGLEGITLRRIGERLGVRPGLVSHCFPVVDELVAEEFGQVVGAELDTLVPPGQTGQTGQAGQAGQAGHAGQADEAGQTDQANQADQPHPAPRTAALLATH
ncbi:hypothetical protein ACGF8B_10530 [Streptomyces sp. NPDC047917]|uniref:hypothetical protein n=1 Tax=Streptomyces sp. NPDC047917 TaxID=3365491 RepID=UPI00371B909E